jgi:hypothetical protein
VVVNSASARQAANKKGRLTFYQHNLTIVLAATPMMTFWVVMCVVLAKGVVAEATAMRVAARASFIPCSSKVSSSLSSVLVAQLV